jgi:hypothetical protein
MLFLPPLAFYLGLRQNTSGRLVVISVFEHCSADRKRGGNVENASKTTNRSLDSTNVARKAVSEFEKVFGMFSVG